MKRKILSLAFLLFSFLGISQEKLWSNRLELQVSSSFTKPDFLYSPGNRPFIDFKNQTSINYAVGWNTAIRFNKNISLESGISLIRRKNKSSIIFDHCFPNPENLPCASILYTNKNRRHHLINFPLRIRLQKQLGDKLAAYWSGSVNNYFHLFTTYKTSDFKRKDSSKNYHGYSINTAFGIRYPFTKRCTIDLEASSRIFEKYRQAEITYGNSSDFDNSSFKNINLLLSLNYYL